MDGWDFFCSHLTAPQGRAVEAILSKRNRSRTDLLNNWAEVEAAMFCRPVRQGTPTYAYISIIHHHGPPLFRPRPLLVCLAQNGTA